MKLKSNARKFVRLRETGIRKPRCTEEEKADGRWLCDIQEKSGEDDAATVPVANGCTVCREERTHRVRVHKYINSQKYVFVFHGSGRN